MVKEGFLGNGGDTGKVWKRSYFVLTGDAFKEYDASEGKSFSNLPEDVPVNVFWSMHFEQCLTTSTEQSHTFALVVSGITKDHESRWVHFCALSGDEAQEWKVTHNAQVYNVRTHTLP